MKTRRIYFNTVRLLYFVLLVILGTAAFAGNDSVDDKNIYSNDKNIDLNLLKEYGIEEYELQDHSNLVMIFDINDNLLMAEKVDDLEQIQNQELYKLLKQSDFLFEDNKTAYYIKTN